MKRWFLKRLRERTTWLSILGMLGLFGIKLEPELQEYIIQGLIALSCIVAFLFPESELVKKADLPPIDLVSRPTADEWMRSYEVLSRAKDKTASREPPEGFNG